MVKMIFEMIILPIDGFPKKKMPLMVGVKNKHGIKQLHFFCQNQVATKK